jgi:NitT/TauT family transport system substrate-binding protein
MLVATLALALTACGDDDDGGGGGGDGAQAGDSLKQVSIRLDWFPDQQHAGYYVAQEKGFYEDAGLDVEIVPGQGSTEVVQQVATGGNDFGNAFGMGVVFGRAEGAKIKAVANYGADADICIIVRADSDISEPSDLEGKTIGNGTGSPFAAMLPVVWANTGVDGDQVTTRDMDAAAGIPSLVQNRIDGWIGNAWSEPMTMDLEFDTKARCLSYRDYGARIMGPSIIASDKLIQEDPETVRKFVNASIKGWAYAFAHPDEAGQAVEAGSEGVEGASPAESVSNAQELLAKAVPSDHTVGKPYGTMAVEDWQATIELIDENLGLKKVPDAASLFTNEFVGADGPKVTDTGVSE